MKIAIFCSANDKIDPDFFKETAHLGRRCAEEGHTIVFGGTNQGLMDCVAKAAHEAGGQVVGIVPTIIEKGGHSSAYMDIHIPCVNLSDRKELMNTQCDIAVALPGGIGTLDEVFTVAASKTIGYHQKSIILYNMKGFFNPLINLLDDLQAQQMIRGKWQEYIQTANNLADIAALLQDMA